MTADKASSRRTLPQVFAAPLALALVTVVGLVAALAGDGAWDAFSWIALGIPLATVVVFVSLSGRSSLSG
jgi:hypothetical protein